MKLLEEFENTMDFEHIQNLSSDEYLIKYVVTTLTKLTAQIAKLRPRNPVDFFVKTIITQYKNCVLFSLIQ